MSKLFLPFAFSILSFVASAPTRAGFTPTPIGLTSPTPTEIGGATILPQASTTLYSNLTNFTGDGFTPGGAAPVSGLGTTTTMIAGEVQAAAGSGNATVTGLSFSVGNYNASAVSAEVLLTFYDTTGSGGGPGAYLGGLLFNPISFGAGGGFLYTYNPGTALFTVPTSGTFWVGEQFVASGSTTSTQLNNLGVLIFAPPTIGTSPDLLFESNSSSSTASSNPAGGFGNFGGNPVANLGFAFTGNPAVAPEPSSLVLTSLAGVLVAVAGARKAAIGRRAPAL